MRDAFLIDGIRTPIGKFGGALSSVRVDDLAALTIKTLLDRHPLLPADSVDDVVFGCANQAGEDNRNLARMSLLIAGMPFSVPGITVNRLCASGMSAAVLAGGSIAVGNGDVFIAGGAENMTRAPYVMSKSPQPFGRDAALYDTSIGWRFPNKLLRERYGTDGMGSTAENLVELYGISREDQDIFSLRSHKKAAAARRAGRFAEEIAPVPVPQRKGDPVVFKDDEFIREDTTLERLASLRPAFRLDGRGSVTAGNSSGINDGACALLVTSEEGATKYGLSPCARIVSSAVVGVEPRIMGIGPVGASRRALDRAELSLDNMAVIELNEAFAGQSIACIRELGLADDDARINPNGGAIALGHPLGMSGARLLLTAMRELVRRNARYALCTMCVGVGQGAATIIERVGSQP